MVHQSAEYAALALCQLFLVRHTAVGPVHKRGALYYCQLDYLHTHILAEGLIETTYIQPWSRLHITNRQKDLVKGRGKERSGQLR